MSDEYTIAANFQRDSDDPRAAAEYEYRMERVRERETDAGSCPTGKRVYYAERLANRAITKAAERGEIGPLRHYKCPDCDWWHLATKFPVSKLTKGTP